MGYENPKTIINQTNAVINNEISKFNQQFNAEFDEINARQAENIEANMKILEEKKMKRELGDDLWYQQVEKYRPKGGYAEDTEAFLNNIHNKYYDLLGCDTSECRRELERLKKVPQQLSEVGGAWDAMHKKYEEANNKELFSPGSFNARTPNYIQQVMENGGYTKKTYNDKTGHVEFEVYDKDGNRLTEKDQNGNEIPMTIDAPEFTKGAMSGNLDINTYGDPVGLRQEFQNGIKKEMGYDDLVKTVEDQSNLRNQIGYKDYTEANRVFDENLKNGNIDALMSDKATMTDSYPVMVNELFKQAKAGDNAAIAALNQLGVLGEDRQLGGGDDLDMSDGLAVQAAIGMWKGSDEQKAVAEAFFKYDGVENMKKPDRIDKKQKLTSKSDSQKLADAKFEYQKKRDAAKDITQKEALEIEKKKQSDVTPNEKLKFTKYYQKRIDAGLPVTEAQRIRFEKYEAELSGLPTPGSEAEAEAPGEFSEEGTQSNPISGTPSTSKAVEGVYYRNDRKNSPDKGKVYQFKDGKYVEVKPTDSQAVDFGEVENINTSNAVEKLNTMAEEKGLKPGETFTFTSGGKTRTLVYNGKDKKPTVYKPKEKKTQPEAETDVNVPLGGTDSKFRNQAARDAAADALGGDRDSVPPPPQNTKKQAPPQKPAKPAVQPQAPVVEEVVEEKPTKVSHGQPKDISDERVDKVADRILTWEKSNGSGVNAGPHDRFGFNSGKAPKTKKEAIARFEKEYGKNFVSGLNDEALFQAVDWKFNAGRDPKHMLLFAAGLIPGTATEQRMRVNSKDPNYSDAVLTKMYNDNEKAIVAFANSNDMRLKKMELYLSPLMVKSGDYTKAQLKTGLQKQWGPRMGLSEAEINKWIDANFETIYNESLNS